MKNFIIFVLFIAWIIIFAIITERQKDEIDSLKAELKAERSEWITVETGQDTIINYKELPGKYKYYRIVFQADTIKCN